MSKHKVKELANYYVPFFNKITTRMVLGKSPICLVDPCRVMVDFINPYIFKPEEIIMHHMTSVRIDDEALYLKYLNSSARQNFESIEKMVQNVKNINYDKIEIVEDIFRINKIFEDYNIWKQKILTNV